MMYGKDTGGCETWYRYSPPDTHVRSTWFGRLELALNLCNCVGIGRCFVLDTILERLSWRGDVVTKYWSQGNKHMSVFPHSSLPEQYAHQCQRLGIVNKLTCVKQILDFGCGVYLPPVVPMPMALLNESYIHHWKPGDNR